MPDRRNAPTGSSPRDRYEGSDFVLPFKEEPLLAGAPPWGQELANRQARDRHALRNEMARLMVEFRQETTALHDKLGEEPMSDGTGGRGLIGDIRKMTRDLDALMDLRNKGIGFIAAVSLFGAIIIAGLIYMVKAVVAHGK